MNSRKIAWTPESIAHDLFLLLSLYCFLTGFIPFAPEKFYQLAAAKPVIHRALLTIFTISGLLWAAARRTLSEKQDLGTTPLISFLTPQPFPTAPWLVCLFLFPAVLWSYASIARHNAFQSGFDMAIFTQSIWNTAEGNFFYSSIKGGICLLGDHFSPLLGLFAIPYKLWPDPRCLLILQASLAASSVFPLYLLGKNKLGRGVWALAPVFALVCYLPLRNSVRFDFHPEVAALPLVFWAWYFWDRSKLILCSVTLLFVLAAKENAALLVFAFGFYALLRRRFIFGIFWMLVSAVWFWTVIHKVIPALSGQPYFYLSGNFLAWKEQGASAFVRHLLRPATAGYLIKILMPLGFLPFGSLAVIPALPALFQNITSRNEATLSIFFQYTAFLTPVLFCALVETLKKSHLRRSGVLFYLIFWSVLMAGVSDYYVASRAQIQETPHLKELPALLKKVPDGASVRTHEFLAPHLANRKELFIFENHHPLEGGSEKAMNADYVILDKTFLGSEDPSAEAWTVNYTLSFEKDGFMIFKNKNIPR